MKKRLCIVLALAIVIISIISYQRPITLSYYLDVLAVDNLDDAIQEADYIVKGNFNNYIKEWNILDDPKEQMIERVYQFNISNSYKGNVSDYIPVSMHYSTRLYYNNKGLIHGDAINNNSKYVDVLEKNYINPDKGKDYILFLSYNESAKVYQAAFYPYCIEVNGNELKTVVNDATSVYSSLVDENKNVKVIQKTHQTTDITKNISYDQFNLRFK